MEPVVSCVGMKPENIPVTLDITLLMGVQGSLNVD